MRETERERERVRQSERRTNEIDGDDERNAEKADRGEKRVEFDREVRRYLFHTCASEIESN